MGSVVGVTYDVTVSVFADSADIHRHAVSKAFGESQVMDWYSLSSAAHHVLLLLTLQQGTVVVSHTLLGFYIEGTIWLAY